MRESAAAHEVRVAAQAAGVRLLYHISKLALRVPFVFTKKHGIYAAKRMLRLRLAFANRTYYTVYFPVPQPKPRLDTLFARTYNEGTTRKENDNERKLYAQLRDLRRKLRLAQNKPRGFPRTAPRAEQY